MSSKVTLLFTAKPGKYPAHKGGKRWLHDRGGARQVMYRGEPTTKVFPRVWIENGETCDFDPATAKTMLFRYSCWSDPKPPKVEKDTPPPKTTPTKESDA